MSDPRLSIVVPTWNRRDLVLTCLASIAAQGVSEVEIIVVDDGGTDDAAEAVGAAYPDVRVIRRERNGGFAQAVNTGIAAAQAPLIMLLNNDATLATGCLATLISYMDAHPEIAIAGPLMLMAEEPGRVYAAGDRIRTNGRPESIGFRMAADVVDFSEAPFGLTAGAAIYRRALFDAIGRFDERFGSYFEDADLCFRARLAGFDCALVREAAVLHEGSASIGDRLWRRTRQCHRNHVLLVLKNMPAPLLARHGAAILAEHLCGLGRVFEAARCHRGAVFALRETIRVEAEVICLLPYALGARRAIQRSRTVSGAALARMLRP